MWLSLPRVATKCWNWILHLWGRRFWAVFVDGDVPKKPEKNVVYVVLDEDEPWHASFICPCGCQDVIHMNLLPDERPCWKLSDHRDGTVTLEPSIFRNTG